MLDMLLDMAVAALRLAATCAEAERLKAEFAAARGELDRVPEVEKRWED